eukprot:NODE_2890_length_1020_cov_3.492276_g2419_i0.p1 GENE.NODE_2890_length_1020_cov_3.492276_g2419_i0~~NODE_2890_length_1020_cov_3.492276_g2419_i0.p1  ORF type:complete len:268 (-),score=17.21 NODE_2890_length_1020_cov_3.492276_g2419_i0:215-1018(-)
MYVYFRGAICCRRGCHGTVVTKGGRCRVCKADDAGKAWPTNSGLLRNLRNREASATKQFQALEICRTFIPTLDTAAYQKLVQSKKLSRDLLKLQDDDPPKPPANVLNGWLQQLNPSETMPSAAPAVQAVLSVLKHLQPLQEFPWLASLFRRMRNHRGPLSDYWRIMTCQRLMTMTPNPTVQDKVYGAFLALYAECRRRAAGTGCCGHGGVPFAGRCHLACVGPCGQGQQLGSEFHLGSFCRLFFSGHPSQDPAPSHWCLADPCRPLH